jgi:ribonuclease HI
VQPNYPPETVIVSCDGSILKNPGGRCSVGVVILAPGNNNTLELAEFTPSSTNNEAEFDAVYLGISTVLAMYPSNAYAIQVESDSKVVVESLRGNYKLKEERLARRRNVILELTEHVERGVTFVWRKRNSTPGLKRANALAQIKNGVKVH